MDLLLVSISYGSSLSLRYEEAFDLNKDGAINPGDMVVASVLYGYC